MGRLAIEFSNPEQWIQQITGNQQSRIYALYLVCNGLTHKEIARAFDRSVRTINKWVYKTMLELGARTKYESFYLAGKMGLFDDFDPFDRGVLMEAGVGKYKVIPKTGRPRLYRTK